MDVQTQLANFAQTTGPGKFTGISRVDVLNGLRERTSDPRTVKQGYAGLCGPAALMHCLLRDDPELYVKYVIDLYNTGHAQLGSLEIKPSDGCRNFNPAGKLPPIDWIALGSLRDSENTVLAYDDGSSGLASMTMPHTLASWFKALGYRQVRNETNVFFTKDPPDLATVHALCLQGQRVCLFINADLLGEGVAPSQSRRRVPDHWIILTSSTGGAHTTSLSATIWSWGKILRLPRFGTLSAEQFCFYFFGYVTAAPP